MTPVVCRVKHDPESGTYGDCLRACIATVLDLDAEAVPHFNHDGCDGKISLERVRWWLADRKLSAFVTLYDGTAEFSDIRDSMAEQNPNLVYLVFGLTSGGGGHVVVCRGGELAHDPGWTRHSLISPSVADENGAPCWMVMTICVG